MRAKITINGSVITDIPSFYEEVNRVFMANEDWRIGQSLDAFNDLLFGGYGALFEINEIDLIWLNVEQSRKVLSYDVTHAYYLEKLEPGSPFNRTYFEGKLERLENGEGETYFDTIISIIAEHPNINLIKK